MTLIDLYRYAEEQNIDVDRYTMDKAESLSLPLPDGTCAVALDPRKIIDMADETWKLAHELGHCETVSFYNRYAPLDERVRNEVRADRWAINKVLPFEELCEAIAQGFREIWELAEHFTLPEPMIQSAIDYYTGPCGLSFQKILPEN